MLFPWRLWQDRVVERDLHASVSASASVSVALQCAELWSPSKGPGVHSVWLLVDDVSDRWATLSEWEKRLRSPVRVDPACTLCMGDGRWVMGE